MLQNIVDHIIVRLHIHKMFICFIFATRYTEKSYKKAMGPRLYSCMTFKVTVLQRTRVRRSRITYRNAIVYEVHNFICFIHSDHLTASKKLSFRRSAVIRFV